ncbi:catecholate siderophore receptor [Sphingopyxis panaciterrae]|nr:catecholate siderophore receptor [Sphingopyxis panaciterrae]
MKNTTSATFLALSCVGSLMSTTALAANLDAETSTDQQSERERREEREQIVVTGDHYQTQQESPKSTRSVRDTPQTVTVITGETIEQQNLLTLRDMLSTVPGITFGAAEGGSPPADSINFRGYSAGSDITQDGVRDSAAYSRSDSFNLEQLEIVNGANSVQSGAGSVGGSINIVTKRPLDDTRVIVTGGVGTDDYYRGTVDANVRVNDLIAVRLNAMAHKNDVPGRDVENYERWGVAPSISIGMSGPTKLTLQYLHQEDDNIPQYGVPYYNGIIPGAHRSDYFGYRNVDTQEITVDQATAIFEHELSDNWSVRNLARWQQVSQLTIVGPPQGTYCLASGVTPTGGACTVDLDTRTGPGQVYNITIPAGYYYITGPRGTYRDSKNELMYDQIDFRGVFNTGAIEHTMVIGASAMWEKYSLNSGSAYRNADGSNPFAFNPAAPDPTAHFPYVNIANPNEIVIGPNLPGATYGSNVYTGPVNLTQTGRQIGEVNNYAVYLFDAMKLGKFELNGGVRYEKSSGSNRNGLGTVIPTEYSDNLFSYRIGAVYKPIEAVTLYAAFGNSKTPSQSSVNGACSDAVANGNCNVKPEGAKNYEIGVKAEVAGGKLLLSAAAFRNERDSYRVNSGDPLLPDQVLEGHSRVDGLALSAVGQILPGWSVTANYTYLKSKVIQSVSDFCLANPGQGSCTNSPAFPDVVAGALLQNTPKHSGSLFTTYELPFGLKVGYGVTYQGKFAFNLPTATVPAISYSDDYWVHNAYLAYDFNDRISAQLNVKNFTDKLYYTRIRNNGWATPGDARSAVLTLSVGF